MSVLANKMQLFIRNTTPYRHLRLDSRIGRDFPIDARAVVSR